MTFYFGDQSSAIAKFVNFSVAFHWVKSRRSWGMKEASQTHSYFAFDAQTENATQKTLPEHDAKTQSQNEVQK